MKKILGLFLTLFILLPFVTACNVPTVNFEVEGKVYQSISTRLGNASS